MKVLNKVKGKDFKILNFTDPQISNHEWETNDVPCVTGVKTMDELIKRVKPDLITVTGDIAYAEHYDAFRRFGEFLNGYNIPFAIVFGNHDNQAGAEASNKEAEIFMEFSNSLFEKGDPSLGCGNYVIKIVEDGKTVSGLIFMDSHNKMSYTNEYGKTWEDWAKLIPEQLVWYKKQIEELKAEGCNDTTIFAHIPFYSYRLAFAAAVKDEMKDKTIDPHQSTDPAIWNEGYEDSFGVRNEHISSYPADEGMIDLMVELGSTKNVIVGHDHTNNFSINYRGVRHTFALKTGTGCYFKEGFNGGTVITINDNGTSVHHEFVEL